MSNSQTYREVRDVRAERNVGALDSYIQLRLSVVLGYDALEQVLLSHVQLANSCNGR